MPIQINYTTGYAGTGKSTELTQLVNKLKDEEIIVIAPTHKALDRLRSHLPKNVEIKTIHSLLGWIPTINENAQKIEHIDSTHKLDKSLEEYSHIIIDEAGMMSEEMFMDIIGKLDMQLTTETEAEDGSITYEDSEDVIVIDCFLDPYQLLPVKGHQIQTDPETTKNLTVQYRSESPDVVELYTKFVDYLIGTNKDDLSTPYSKNVLKFDIKQFKKGDRLLAYTNQAVGEWNIKIAKSLNMIGYIKQEVQLGNMIETQTVESFINPSLEDLIKWREVGLLKMQNNQISKKFLEASLRALIENKHIQFIKSMDGDIYPVIIGVGSANKVIKAAKVAAVKDKKKFKDVYALGRAFIMDYTFATTVHKSQGSEFNTVFIDKIDIQKSILQSYYMTYARLMYVSLSRAKKIIYI